MLVKRNSLIVPNFMNDFFKPDWFGGTDVSFTVPAVNISEHESDFELEFAIPGFKKEDFNIEVDNDVLTVSAEVKHETDEKTEMYTRREFTVSSFKRAFTLPDTINEDTINAVYEGGVLTITLPKLEEALPKPKRLIEIE